MDDGLERDPDDKLDDGFERDDREDDKVDFSIVDDDDVDIVDDVNEDLWRADEDEGEENGFDRMFEDNCNDLLDFD